MHQPAYIIMIVADALAPNPRQVINLNHAHSAMTADVTWTMYSRAPF